MLFFLIGLALAGAAVYLVARAVSIPRVRTAETIAKIDSYGYSRGAEESDDTSAVRGVLDDIAGAVGTVVAGRFGGTREQEVRNRLMAAGIYSMAPRRFSISQLQRIERKHRTAQLGIGQPGNV